MNKPGTQGVVLVSSDLKPNVVSVVCKGTKGFLHPDVEALFAAKPGTSIRLIAATMTNQELAALPTISDPQERR